MAETLAKKALLDRSKDAVGKIRFSSAGTAALPDARATGAAIAVMNERGIDLSKHKATLLSPPILKEADLILTMTRNLKKQVKNFMPDQKGKVFSLAEFAGANMANMDIEDPIGRSIHLYRKCAADLYYLINLLLDKLLL